MGKMGHDWENKGSNKKNRAQMEKMGLDLEKLGSNLKNRA